MCIRDRFMDLKSPQGFLDKLKMLPLLTEAGKFFPKIVSTGPCKEVIKRDGFSLLDFPILQCWPKDAGRFITLPCVTTRDPKSGKRNLGMYLSLIHISPPKCGHFGRRYLQGKNGKWGTARLAEFFRESFHTEETRALEPRDCVLPSRGQGVGPKRMMNLLGRPSQGREPRPRSLAPDI